MRLPPRLRGGVLTRSVSLVVGLFLCALGIVAFLEAELGLPPWDVLHQGLADRTPLSFGAANVAVSLAVLALAWRLGAHIGVGTVANAVLIGTFVQLLVLVGPIDALSDTALPVRAALVPVGVALFGVGSAFYISPLLGAGPRDSLMLVGAQRTRTRVGIVRTVLEATTLGGGVLLGGTAGVGTLAFVLLIGPAVESSFWLLARSGLATPQYDPPAVAGTSSRRSRAKRSDKPVPREMRSASRG